MIEQSTDTWQEVEALAKRLLADSTCYCVTPGINERVSDFHRGVVFAVNKVLELRVGQVAPSVTTLPFE